MLPGFLTNPDPHLYYSQNYIVLDFETTNKSKGNPVDKDNRLVFGAWYDNLDQKIYCSHKGELSQTVLAERCERTDFIVAHNAKMELGWLKRCGVDLHKLVVFDTMIAEYVMAGNQKVKLGLGAVAKRYGLGTKDPYVDASIRAGVCPSELPVSFLTARCIKDVQQTHGVFLQQLIELDRTNKLKTFCTHCLLTPVLADIESNGMCLDKEAVFAEIEQARVVLAEVETQLALMTGGINLRSPKQLNEYMYVSENGPRFKPLRVNGKDVMSADSKILKQLKCTNKKQREFLALKFKYAEVNALLVKNLEFFEGICNERDGIFYAQFNQTVTQTHRLSSSGIPIKFSDYPKPKSVQFQNMPRGLKKLFRARHPDFLMGEGDGAQLEFRVAAFMGQDVTAYKSILEEEDVHTFTAKTLTEAGQPTARQEAKASTFKPLYGGQSGTDAEQAYYKAFRAKYYNITSTQEEWKSTVLKEKSLVLPTGMRFYWPDTTVSKSGYITNTPSICNYPVQYFATGEIIPIGLVFLWHTLQDVGAKSFLVNTIHDSVIGEVHKDEQELYVDAVNECFTTHVYDYLDKLYGIKFNVPLGTGIKISTNWGKGEERKFSKQPPFAFGQ